MEDVQWGCSSAGRVASVSANAYRNLVMVDIGEGHRSGLIASKSGNRERNVVHFGGVASLASLANSTLAASMARHSLACASNILSPRPNVRSDLCLRFSTHRSLHLRTPRVVTGPKDRGANQPRSQPGHLHRFDLAHAFDQLRSSRWQAWQEIGASAFNKCGKSAKIFLFSKVLGFGCSPKQR
jgi:hypothetical protein